MVMRLKKSFEKIASRLKLLLKKIRRTEIQDDDFDPFNYPLF